MNALTAEAQYEQDGFTVFHDVIDRALLREIGEHLEWLQRRYPDIRPEHLHHPLMRDDAFWARVVTDDRLLSIAERFLGPDLACFTAHYIAKPPGDGYAVLWHQDGAYWNLDPLEAVTLWLAVDECDRSNGCLRMLPGTHRRQIEEIVLRKDVPNMLCSSVDTSVVDETKAVDICLSPGDVSVHHPNIIHGSEANRSTRRRCGLDIGFIRTSTRIKNEGLYLNPILVKGRAVEGVNRYRPWPAYDETKTIPFRGSDIWNRKAQDMNRRSNVAATMAADEDVRDMAMRMIHRLEAGTTKYAAKAE